MDNLKMTERERREVLRVIILLPTTTIVACVLLRALGSLFQ